MTIWVVCGAARGVGKTHLASGLATALPNALRAKLGHGVAKADGPPNYFRSTEALASFVDRESATREHLVIESNAWARAGHGDVIVFLGKRSGGSEPRPDADELAARAHIRLGCDQSPRQWQSVLRQHLRPVSERKAVLDLLCDQQARLAGSQIDVRSKTWLVIGGTRAFGGGIARLLREVEATGSLRSAAAVCRISYRHSWDLIQAAQQRLGTPLIEPRSGGVGGGSSVLTAHGRYWLGLYARLDAEVAEFADRRFVELRSEGAGP